MAQSSPSRGVPWQYLGPTNVSGRATDVAVADTALVAADLRRLRDERGLGVRRPWRDLARDLRERSEHQHRRHRRREIESRHRLGRDRRGEPVPRVDAGRRHLQVDRRRPDVHARRPDRHADDRPHRHPSDQPGHCLCRRIGTCLDRKRDPRRVHDVRRRPDVVEGVLQEPENGSHRSGDGSRRSEHAVCRDLAAHPAQVERSARRARIEREWNLEEHRRRENVERRQPGPSAGAVPRPHRAGRGAIESAGALRVRRQLRCGQTGT